MLVFFVNFFYTPTFIIEPDFHAKGWNILDRLIPVIVNK